MLASARASSHDESHSAPGLATQRARGEPADWTEERTEPVSAASQVIELFRTVKVL